MKEYFVSAATLLFLYIVTVLASKDAVRTKLSGDLWHFPFQQDVWGHASDWVMVIVTTLTGLAIWNTLKSQTKVQKLQQTASNIEVRRYLEEIKPDFDLTFVIAPENRCKLTLKVAKNNPFNFIYEIEQNCRYKLKDVTPGSDFFSVMEYQALDNIRILLECPDDFISLTSICHVNIFYKDKIGTQYEINYRLTRGQDPVKKGPKMVSDIPKYIN